MPTKTIILDEVMQSNIDSLILLFSEGNYSEAEIKATFLIKNFPQHAFGWKALGAIYQRTGRSSVALVPLEKAAAFSPDDYEAHFNLGLVQKAEKQLTQAVISFRKSLHCNPDYLEADLNLSICLIELGCFEEAELITLKIIDLRPQNSEAYNNLGASLKGLGRLEEAADAFRKAISLQPKQSIFHNNLGSTLSALGQFDEALQSYDQAIQFNPTFLDPLLNQGSLLNYLKRFEEALVSYEQLLSINPDSAEFHNIKGYLLQKLNQPEKALASFNMAISIKADYAEAYNNRGIALQELSRIAEAISSFNQAISIKADYAEAYANCGNTLLRLRRLKQALFYFDKAIELKPHNENFFITRLFTKMQVCDWSDFEKARAHVESVIRSGKSLPPWTILSINDDPELNFLNAQLWNAQNISTNSQVDFKTLANSHKKIRIGYFSADFHNHATMHLIAELLELHSKDRFEIYGFSFGPNRDDEMRRFAIKNFNQFFDVSALSDREISQLSRDTCIDIAVDLKGYTQDSRAGIFSARCAPIQINYLGFPGSLGAGYMDYIIADKLVIPPQNQIYFSEKIIYLPVSYLANNSKRHISKKLTSRKEMGLPEGAFVFACFNNNYKILPPTFDLWMNILRNVDGSVLWLLEDNLIASNNLRKEALVRGIDPLRLIFAKRVELSEHLARHYLADLFLDTLPFNGHTTASDALFAGLPVLTLMGKSFAGRVASSLLMTLNLPNLITYTAEDYVTKALALALNPELLFSCRQELAFNIKNSPLFKGGDFAQHIETAFQTVYDHYKSGLRPTNFILD